MERVTLHARPKESRAGAESAAECGGRVKFTPELPAEGIDVPARVAAQGLLSGGRMMAG
jgi:hypothetical protein